MLSGERRLLEWTDKNEDGTFTVKHLDVPVEMTYSFNPDSPHAGTMLAKWSEFTRPIHSMPYDKQGYMHGVEEAWYANGTKRVHAPREKGLNHGVIEFWDENGRSVLKGICKNDKAVGLWHEDKKALEDWVDHSDLPEEMTGPWFFYSDQQDLPIAHGTTPDKVMKQSVVQDYLAEKGISIERELGTYICRFDDKVLIAPVFIEELMLDREELVHALMDKADVPWFDTYANDEPEPVQACALPPPAP